MVAICLCLNVVTLIAVPFVTAISCFGPRCNGFRLEWDDMPYAHSSYWAQYCLLRLRLLTGKFSDVLTDIYKDALYTAVADDSYQSRILHNTTEPATSGCAYVS